METGTLLFFNPLYQTRPWGGRRLNTCLGRNLPDAQPYGESWELVDRENEQSVVTSGPWAGKTLHDLWTTDRESVFGAVYANHPTSRFPLLIKVLDCSENLSIQVHPPATVASSLNGEPKTEIWYVAASEPDSKMYAGLKEGVNRQQFESAIRDGTVEACVHALAPEVGDSLLVESGRLHALGGGLLIYEIQQNSDTTYRVFDWNRVGLDGVPRKLHIDESMQCINFQDFEPSLLKAGERAELAACQFFSVARRKTGDGLSTPVDRFRLIMPLVATSWGGIMASPGQAVLLPASAVPGYPEPEGEWLEIGLP